jgi:drug/metabolite transporter (DMT)-like permease
MVIIGGVLLSLLGIGVRIMEQPDSLRIVFYRAVAQCIFLTLVVCVMHRGNTLAQFTGMGRKGFFAACLIAAAGLFMVTSITYTTVANAVFIISLAPLCSALLGRMFLGEQVLARTWVAIAIAFVGIVIIFGDGLSTGGLFGMFLAFLMMFCYSSSIVVIRSQSGSTTPANIVAVCALNAFILSIAVSPFVGDLSISTHDLLICIFLGVVQIGLGMVLIIVSAQYLPAAQVSLLALLEVILSPIWVWIWVGEEPSFYTLLGGTIVLIGVILQALTSVDHETQASVS